MTNTTRELKLHDFHIKLLYQCCNLSSRILLNGYSGNPKPVRGGSSSSDSSPEGYDVEVKIEVDDNDGNHYNANGSRPVARLHPDDILACIEARPKLSAETLRWTFIASERPPPNRGQSDQCSDACVEAARSLREEPVDASHIEASVSYAALVGNGKEYYSLIFSFCSNCAEYYAETEKEAQQSVLDGLGELFTTKY